MSESVQKHIFERFYKTTSHTDSNGLGLAITKSIIERHHGEISVNSQLGDGTTFTIILPRHA